MSKAAKRERQRLNREARREAELAAEKRSKMWKNIRNVALLLIPVAIAFVLFQVLRDDDSSADDSNNNDDRTSAETPAPPDDGVQRSYSEPPPMTIDTAATYTATLETSEGTIEVNLDAAAAPASVNNFVFLANNKFYDGLAVNRVSENFVVQTGSPDNSQSGGPGYTVAGEVPLVPAGEPAYPVGTVAFAKSGAEPAGTAGSQFFIVFGDGSLQLPPDYALIGQVTAGLNVAKKIGELYPEGGDGAPTKNVFFDKVTITES